MRNWPREWRYPADARPTAARRAMVVTTDRYASAAGLEVLRSGGNALDASVAAAFALAVVNPEAGNLGGGGFLVLHDARGTAAALDHRSTAPALATRDMFLDERGEVGEAAVIGHLSVGVPGTVLGLWEAHRRFGRLPWGRLVGPALSLARGFVVPERFLFSFTRDVVEGLGRFPTSAATFLPDGRPPARGSVFRQPDLARTLERIRDRGPDGFYRGETADLLVAEMQRGGGLLTHEDLDGYQVVWRDPVRVSYRGHTLLSMPPPSSGGVALALACTMLEPFGPGAMPWHGVEHVHLLAEVWRRTYADRNHYLADPAFHEMPLETLVSPDYAAWRVATLSPDAATPSRDVGPGVEGWLSASSAEGAAPWSARTAQAREGEHTTHLSVVDGEGNAVSLTTTVNSWYGSKVVAAGTGVLLNNDMDDFTSKPGAPNQFGLVQGEANRIEPGKRMLSAMSPTVVLDPDGRLAMVVGSPGGSTIITTVFQVVANVVDHGMDVAQAVLAPRVHHQHLPDQIWYEPAGLPREVVEGLEALGHRTVEREEPSGDVQAIRVLPDGTLQGQSDPRRGGVALGF